MLKQKKVGLFGGAFDPIHVGHQQVAQTLIAKNILDEVWFVPVFQHPWAKKLGKEAITPYAHRVRMIEATLSASAKIHPELASKLALREYKSVSYAFDTLEFFSHEYPDIQFSWIMGSEYLSRFDEFLALHPHLTDYPFYIYPRAGFPLTPLASNMIALREVDEVLVSSTQVRQLIKLGQSVHTLVVPDVERYILREHLYQG